MAPVVSLTAFISKEELPVWFWITRIWLWK